MLPLNVSNSKTIFMTRTRNNPRKGAITVEVALCLPILFLLLFGCYELAQANMMLHATQSAAYEGARAGIVPGATREKIETSVAFVLRSLDIDDFEVELNPPNLDGESLEVTVRVPLANNLTLPRMFIDNPTFRAQTVLRREVP